MSLADTSLLAVDLGTTTIVASLLDFKTGERLASGMALNPQRQFGDDVVTRISAAVYSETDRHKMARLVNEELQSLAFRLLSQAGRSIESLAKIAVAGNPAMEHLLLGLSVDSLARIPYRPLFTEGKTLRSSDIGWKLDVELFVFPLPGGFVGGDLVAFLYGQLDNYSKVPDSHSQLFLDLGTNAEIALQDNGVIYATSAAAGPAFEGGNLACGMPALPGAINSVTISGEQVFWATIGNVPPKGLCGTGALTAVVSMLDAGLIESEGRLLRPEEIPSNLANRMVERNGELVFTLYRDSRVELFLTQTDIRGIQLAKGAIRGGVEILLGKAGVIAEAVSNVVVSGSFGFSVAADCLCSLGIVAPEMIDRVKNVADGSLTGVERLLLEKAGIPNVNALAEGIKMLPLSGNPLFEKLFLNHMDFPKRQDSN